jgi:hypothetical protein
MKIRMTEDWPDAFGVVEASIHLVREHILLSMIFVIIIHYALNWFVLKLKMVSTVIIKIQNSRPKCHVYMRRNRVGLIVGLTLSISLLRRVQQLLKEPRWWDQFTSQFNDQFPKGFFRVMLLGRSSGLLVVDHDHLKEIFEAPNEEINFLEGLFGDTDFRYTFYGDVHNEYHVRVIRNQLTQNIASLIPDVVDELNAALEDEIDSVVRENGKVIIEASLS